MTADNLEDNLTDIDIESMPGLNEAERMFIAMGAGSPHPHPPQGAEWIGKELPDNIHDKIMWYCIGPLSILGFVFNCLVFYLWSSEDRFRVTILLFRVLAVVDNAVMLFFNIWFYCPRNSRAAVAFYGLTFGTQNVLLNVTLLLVFCRAVQVRAHSQAKQILTKTRIRVTLVVIVVVCDIMKLIEVVMFYESSSSNALITFHVEVHLLNTIPIILLVTLSLWLVWTLCVSKVSPSSPPQRSARLSSKSQLRMRYLTYTILCISLMTLVAYPLGVVIRLLLQSRDEFSKEVLSTVVNVLHTINTSVKFFFYLAFLPRFRSLMLLRFITMYTGSYQTRVLRDTGKEMTSAVPTGMSFTRPSLDFASQHVKMSQDMSTRRTSVDSRSGAFNLYKQPGGDWVVRERSGQRFSLSSNPGRASIFAAAPRKINAELTPTSSEIATPDSRAY